ncbi:MAG: 23S rRNA (pseudouridine(1915)-N(3))-methyltransferase RlmH [Oscillospiraceae bacterium]|nr:23S rRNA (pseudouridine(1915)-N(3))-methyltransferase RlmH [Oscillospiraceae bacterium]
MKVTILCIGKIKEKFYVDAIKEYAKRMTRFADLEIVELPDEQIPDNASEKEKEAIKKREGEKILAKIKPQSYVISLCIEGRTLDSPELAKTIKDAYMRTSNVTFIIGGSLGLSDEVKSRSDLKLSFGRMTLPHQLMRVVLAEQIYRAFMINIGAAYHK